MRPVAFSPPFVFVLFCWIFLYFVYMSTQFQINIQGQTIEKRGRICGVTNVPAKSVNGCTNHSVTMHWVEFEHFCFKVQCVVLTKEIVFTLVFSPCTHLFFCDTVPAVAIPECVIIYYTIKNVVYTLRGTHSGNKIYRTMHHSVVYLGIGTHSEI